MRTYKTSARLNAVDTDAAAELTATGGSGDRCSGLKSQTIDVPDAIKSGVYHFGDRCAEDGDADQRCSRRRDDGRRDLHGPVCRTAVGNFVVYLRR